MPRFACCPCTLSPLQCLFTNPIRADCQHEHTNAGNANKTLRKKVSSRRPKNCGNKPALSSPLEKNFQAKSTNYNSGKAGKHTLYAGCEFMQAGPIERKYFQHVRVPGNIRSSCAALPKQQFQAQMFHEAKTWKQLKYHLRPRI